MSSPSLVGMEADSVRRAYKRWAPVYDAFFGRIADAGRMQAAAYINSRSEGRILEVGVGTGISLPLYHSGLRVTGIDLSPEMLANARKRVAKERLSHVEAVLEMDAADTVFADGTFDVVVAMYVLTVVPDPASVMAELARVCRPGGEVIIVNHFSREHGLLGLIERTAAPLAATLGWRPEFPLETILTEERLDLVSVEPMKPGGLFSLARFRRIDPAAEAAPGVSAAMQQRRQPGVRANP